MPGSLGDVKGKERELLLKEISLNQRESDLKKREEKMGSNAIDYKGQTIPKFIFQTHKYKENEIPVKMKESMDNIKKLNKDYKYEYYDDDAVLKFFADSFGKDSEEYMAYTCFVNPAFKADIFRYAIVYIKGGYYMDADLSFAKSLDEIVPKDITFVSPICDDPLNGFFQAFLGATPRHPILRTALDKIIWNIRNKFNGHLYEYTGPRVLQKAFNIHMRRQETIVLTTGIFDFPTHGKGLIQKECCWIIHKTCFVAADCAGDKEILFYSRYSDYEKEKPPGYWVDLFHQGVIYKQECLPK